MSFNNTDTTGGGEGFRESRGGVESYGQGPGSGATDPANTGLGGYGSNPPQQRASDDQQFRTTSNFDNSPDFQQQTQGSGTQRAFGDDRGEEKSGFSGSDDQYKDTTAGSTFAQRSSAGLGQRNDFDDTTGGGNIPGTRSSGAASGGQFDNNTGNQSTDNQEFGGGRDDQFGDDSQRERQGGKATFGDKMRGNVEKLAGSVTGKPELKERGQDRKMGEL
ncbi:uncharacterized protein FOMMEDRAFT_148442 [Fomitiporia mediterranea MF3/22]|uniref:uncharacterized protein n=1 Tax=Fomitiporia mediterranea (strain MF3/22) TaxID=694068 RepID=UPI0004409962|nr:uncharacterized protein FOMMEDRAFT_148442 [Fomitiporia mediterranea MF3/22]EJD00131.1 hypothetical protein FOMMEDRAFT_148442 [Fomitiporia mediterranea MF3/22]